MLQKFLKKVDFFGTPVSLHINGKKKYNTELGGCSTILLMLVTLFFTIYQGIDVIMKRNPNLINYQSYAINNKMKLNNSNYFLAFQAIYANKTLIDLNNPFFKFKVYSEETDKINTENSNSPNLSPLKIRKCLDNDMIEFEMSSQTNQFIKNSFNCIDMQDDLEIYGSPFHSLKTKVLKLEIYYTYLNLLKIYGSSINMYKSGIFPLTFRFFYQTYSYNPNNYENPIKKELSFFDVRIMIENLTHIFASFIRVNSTRDDGILFSSKNQTSLLGFNNFQTFVLNNVQISQTNLAGLLSFSLYSDFYEMNFLRSYEKIQKVGAEILVIYRSIFAVFSILIDFYTINRVNEILVSSFYKISLDKSMKINENLGEKKIKIHGPSFKIDCKNNQQIESENKNKINKDLSYNIRNKSKILDSTFKLPKLFLTSINDDISKNNLEIYQQQPADILSKKNNENNLNSISIMFSQSQSQSQSESKLIGSSHQVGVTMSKILPCKVDDKIMPLQGETQNPKFRDEKIILGNIEPYQIKMDLNSPTSRSENNIEKNSFIEKDKKFIFKNRKFHLKSPGDKKNEVEKIISNQENEKLGFIDKFYFSICCKKDNLKLKNKIIFYQKAGELIKKKIDIKFFLSMSEEFQKYKILFLNPFQSLAARYTKKPNISKIIMSNVVDYYEYFCNSNNHTKNITKIMEYFSEKIENDSLDMTDRKLLEILDEDIKKGIII